MERGLTLAIIALVSASMQANAAPEPAPSTPPATKPAQMDTTEFPGLPWGSFQAFPELIFWTTRDDNIYAQRTGEVEDTVYTLSPSLLLKSDWQRHALNLDAGGDLDRYQDQSSEDVNDYWLGFDGTVELTEQTQLFGGMRHTRDHEDRYVPGTPGPDLQREPTQYDHNEGHLGVASEIGRVRLRGGATYDSYDFENDTTTTGNRINNDDRRHDLTSLGVRAGYVLSPNYEPFIQYATDRRSYDAPIDGTTFNRDSDGYRAALGMRFKQPQRRISGEVFAGSMRQRFDHSGFSDIHKPYFGALLAWRPNPVTRVTGFIDRSLEETTLALNDVYAAASLDTSYGFKIERELTSRLSVLARAAYIDSEYQSFDRQDKIIDAGAGLRYYVSPTVFVGGDLRVIDRASDDMDGEYRRSQLTFSLGYTPGRSRNYRLPLQTLASAGNDPLIALPLTDLFSGAYAGAAISHGQLDTQTSGTRGGDGSDTSPFGAPGFGEALFLGYGQQFQRWYLGIEAEAEQSQARWSFSKDKADARSTSLDKDDSYGLSLRGGYVVNNGSLLYLRAGRVRTRFDSYYTINQQAALASDQDDRQDGNRLGIGADVPAGERLFLRMEYAYTDYDAYHVAYTNDDGPTSERFATEEGQFRLGLGWRFGGAALLPIPLQPATQGFYAGAQIGHGGVDSRLEGRHSESGEPPFSQAFAGDFAGMGGVYGVFAGYGKSFGRWYAGLEAEVDTARIDWKHTRETSGAGGRDFSVEKKSDYGVALRLGYSLPNGTLLYGRAGPVRGRFNTTWAKGNNPDANIDRSYKVNGTRYGMGAEIPLSQNAFARLDYTRTYYDSYGFKSGHGAPDEMDFENRESLFRMGLGFRF
ncbi:MAG: outer membrane beta-barrel protein [Pseudomonas sp.]|uniref:outer membrane beta-barrel protein n=1 Tax=Pseudomonas sp. TaxID=306 RepID=UPI00299EBC76|nr:outer membrane beta-barrel protein [Pseudomonas sp.]MDX1724567.1 outer membrane beta-barrel protein [Pseudomonas sp.]